MVAVFVVAALLLLDGEEAVSTTGELVTADEVVTVDGLGDTGLGTETSNVEQ